VRLLVVRRKPDSYQPQIKPDTPRVIDLILSVLSRIHLWLTSGVGIGQINILRYTKDLEKDKKIWQNK
jgi:hypothetical protein